MKFFTQIPSFIIALVFITITQAQEMADIEVYSIFADDTCSAPCWFGLVPGTTTNVELNRMLELNHEFFRTLPPEDTDFYLPNGQLLNGYVELLWINNSAIASSLINVEQGIIRYVKVFTENTQTISDVYEIYGNPDFSSFLLSQVPRLDLVYIDESIAISLRIVDDSETLSLDEAFRLDHIRYFSSTDLEEIIESYIVGDLFADRRRLVPLETIQCWLDKSDDCITDWWDLPEDKDIDLSQWLDPAPTSLFADDICSAPCWFGITPEQTGTNSVMQFLEGNAESINIPSQYETVDSNAEEAYVRFSWVNPSVVIPIDSRATIYIVDNIVDFLLIPANESHSIYDVVELYGEPDVATWYFGRVDRLYFIYVEESIVVTLGILPTTDFNDYDEAFNVYEVRYFSPSDLEGIFDTFIYSSIDPEGTRIVPPEVLQCWADETNTDPCISSWWNLPEDKDIDLSQWLDPAPTSLFPYNTCVTPCWMGITAGLSTSLDIDRMLEKHDETIELREYGINIARSRHGEYAIDETTGIIERGSYHFDVLTPISTGFSTTSSRIDIRNGKVDGMFILSSQEYDLSGHHVLNTIGTPDEIHLHYPETASEATLYLIYLDSSLRIVLKQSTADCLANDIRNDLHLWGVLYFSAESAEKLVKTTDYQGILQNNLTSFGLENERNVPLDVWESWLSGDVEETCYEAWSKLEPPDLEAIAITPTPTLEVTAEPTP